MTREGSWDTWSRTIRRILVCGSSDSASSNLRLLEDAFVEIIMSYLLQVLFKKNVLTCVVFPDIPAVEGGCQDCIWPFATSCFEADKMD
jgi:hypothetical protein